MEILRKTESRLLGRIELDVSMPDAGGKLSRRDAIAAVAGEMKVEPARVGLVKLKQQYGTRDVVGTFYVYGSEQEMKKLHAGHLAVRALTKEEREKLKQEKKKKAAPTTEAK